MKGTIKRNFICLLVFGSSDLLYELEYSYGIGCLSFVLYIVYYTCSFLNKHRKKGQIRNEHTFKFKNKGNRDN